MYINLSTNVISTRCLGTMYQKDSRPPMHVHDRYTFSLIDMCSMLFRHDVLKGLPTPNASTQ